MFGGAFRQGIYTASREGAATTKADTHSSRSGVWAPGGPLLRGDRTLGPLRQGVRVTFIAAEDLEAIERETGVRVKNGEHRRNVVMRGMNLRALRDKRFRVGEALFEYRKYYPFLLFPSRSLCFWLTDIGNTIQATHATVHLRDNS